MLEDFRLKVFMTLDRCHSFTAAAKELGITQPAVSQNVSELERQLGVQLFERTREGAFITPDGQVFKEYARQILHWYDAAQKAFSGEGAASPAGTKIVLEDGREARIWSSCGDIHIKID